MNGEQMNLLQVIFDKQRELNSRILKKHHGLNYEDLCNQSMNSRYILEHRIKWILNYNRAQVHESMELEDSLPWKWWKEMDLKDIDWDNVRIELIDELHFWVSKCQLAGLDPESLAELYAKKHKLNHVRQDKGYGSSYQKYDENGIEDNKRMDELE